MKTTLTLLVSLLITLPLFSQEECKEIKAAREAIAKGKYERALKYLNDQIRYDAHDIVALELRMDVYQKTANYAELCKDINTLRLYEHPDADKYTCADCDDNIRRQPMSGEVLTTAPTSDQGDVQMPTYPGGDAALYGQISKSIIYPTRCKEMNISGKIFVSFIVDREGNICNVEISKGVQEAPELGWEACKGIHSLAKFNPATMNGKPVNMKMTLPVTFKLM